jgi:hypothetical protein
MNLGSRGIRVCAAAALFALLLLPQAASAKEIACEKSGIAFDAARYTAAYEFICKKEVMDEDKFDKLRATKGRNWQELIDFGQAFLPPHTLVETTIMSSKEGHYGSVYLVTAIGAHHLSEPKLRQAIEAMTKANPLGVAGEVTWRAQDTIGDYAIDFYEQRFPESNVGGGPRECMGFVRYIHGLPPDHPQRVIGTYCEIGTTPISAAHAGAVLETLMVRPELVEE